MLFFRKDRINESLGTTLFKWEAFEFSSVSFSNEEQGFPTGLRVQLEFPLRANIAVVFSPLCIISSINAKSRLQCCISTIFLFAAKYEIRFD